jgi:hypothetical protein
MHVNVIIALDTYRAAHVQCVEHGSVEFFAVDNVMSPKTDWMMVSLVRTNHPEASNSLDH